MPTSLLELALVWACGDILKGFATQSSLFEVMHRGMTVSIHRCSNQEVLNELLEYGHDYIDNAYPAPVCLTIPLSCYRKVSESTHKASLTKPIFLCLAPALDCGEWRRIGNVTQVDHDSWVTYEGAHYPVYG